MLAKFCEKVRVGVKSIPGKHALIMQKLNSELGERTSIVPYPLF
jgi:hypothetical protein